MIDKVFPRIKPKNTNPYSELLPINPKGIKIKKQKTTKNKYFKPFSKKSSPASNHNKAPHSALIKPAKEERVGEHLLAPSNANLSATRSANRWDTSKKETHSPSDTTIIVDNRERNSLVPAELRAKDFKIKFEQLKVGDYLVNDTIIERKEINDLIQSIKNKRIWRQLQEIKQYPNYMLIIEGDIYSQKSLHPNALRGFLLSTATSYKVPIIFVRHPKETVQYIELLANKKQKEHSTNPTKKQLTFQEQQQYILEAFPNIGPTKAKQLIEKFSSLKKIFTATKEELKPILGNKAKEFLKQLE
ncbi:MAG: hypothetical protein PF542_03020 [Nanoarchaeota archaeon]|jgi:ERCC4-type nuclease|nr:hypothetical protein [Nanoarchaeota archaeon]